MGLRSARQFENGNFRRGAETDGDAEGADPAVHVKLCVLLLKPPADVGRDQAGGRNARVDELQGHLTAVRVASQAQVNSQLGAAVKGIGVMTRRLNALKESRSLSFNKQ